MNFPPPRPITPQQRIAEARKCIREGNTGGALNELMFLESQLACARLRWRCNTCGETFDEDPGQVHQVPDALYHSDPFRIGVNVDCGPIVPFIPMSQGWIITRQEPLQHECLRCGAIEPIKVPIAVSAFLKQARKFIREHKGCLGEER